MKYHVYLVVSLQEFYTTHRFFFFSNDILNNVPILLKQNVCTRTNNAPQCQRCISTWSFQSEEGGGGNGRKLLWAAEWWMNGDTCHQVFIQLHLHVTGSGGGGVERAGGVVDVAEGAFQPIYVLSSWLKLTLVAVWRHVGHRVAVWVDEECWNVLLFLAVYVCTWFSYIVRTPKKWSVNGARTFFEKIIFLKGLWKSLDLVLLSSIQWHRLQMLHKNDVVHSVPPFLELWR